MFARLFGRRGVGLALVVVVGLQASPGADNPVLSQQAYLKALAPGAGDTFGDVVATDGDTIVVGAPFEDGAPLGSDGIPTNTVSNAGAAYVYVRQAGAWQFQAYLKAATPVTNDQFGRAVAISGDTIVVGADGQSSSSGAAYVFVRTAGVWTEQAFLKASNAAASDGFGRAVAIDGDTIVVGATGEDSGASGVNGNEADNTMSLAGAAYVFTRTSTTWTQQAYVKASNPTAGDSFGGGVAISGETIVVGAEFEDSAATGVNGNQADESAVNAGAAYVFVRNAGTWTQQAYLKQSNTGIGRSSFGGRHVAIDGERIAIGAPLEDTGTTNSGAIYIFERSGVVWTEAAFLKATNAQASDNFGGGINISGAVVVAGATLEDGSSAGINGAVNESANGAGAAYVFQRIDDVWEEIAYVKASNPAASDQFGLGVAVSGGRVVIGAIGEDGATELVNGDQLSNTASGAGAVYVFHLNGLNAEPVAIAGDDRLVEATSPAGAVVNLSGLHSYDTDGDPLTWSWTNSVGDEVATTPEVSVALALGTHVFTLTANDGLGGIGTDTVVVTVADTLAPTVTITAPLAQGYPFGATILVTFECADSGSGIATCVGDLPSGAALPTSVGGAFTFTVTATDVAGLSTSVAVPYSITQPCAAGSYLAAPGDEACTPAPAGSYVDMPGATSATLCAPGSYSPAPGAEQCTLAPDGSYVPGAGATSSTLCPTGMTSGVGAVVCVDVTAPVISDVPSNFLVPATSASGATVTYALPTATDVVDGARPVTCAPPSGSTFVIGSQVVTCTTADAVGNTTEASFTVTVGLWCSPGSYLAAPADATCTPAPAGSYVPTAGATSPTLCPIGTTSEVGAVSCADVTAPVISDVPTSFLVPATSASGATVTYTMPTAADVVDGARPVTCVPPSGSTFAIGSQVVTCTAADTVGNTSEASFTVTVGLWCSPGSYLAAPADATCTPAPAGSYVPTAGATAPTLCPTGTTSDVGAVSCADVTAPVISDVPSNFLVPATSASGATVTYTLPTATDVVDGARPVTCVPPSGSTFVIGSQVVTCTAADTVGNTSEANFTVTVGLWCSPGSYLAAPADATCTLAPAGSYVPTAGATAPTLCPTGTTSEVGAVSCADVTAPVISDVPSNSLVPATSGAGATVTYTLPTATDVVDGARPVTCVPPSGSTFAIGSQVVTCTTADTVGNSSEASFTVTVGLWCSPGSYLAAPADATCTPAPAGSYVPTAGATAPTLCPTGTTSDVGAVSCADVTAPVISDVPTNFLVPATSASGATVTYATPTATDVVDGARPVTCVPPSGSVMAIGSQVVTCTTADTVGNTSEANFTVTVGLWCSPGSYLAAPADATCTPAPAGSYVPTAGATAPTLCPTGTTSEIGAVSCADVTAPVISDVPSNFLVSATSASGATVSYTTPTATDVVDGARPVTCVPPSGSTFAIGSQVVTCTTEDTVGNSSEASFTVTVGLWCSPGSYLAAPADATCTPAPAGSYVPTAGATSPTLCPTGTTSDVGAVSCADVTAPVISDVPTNFLVPATSASGATVTYTLPTATDVADGARPVICAPPSGSTFAIGSQIVTCTAADTVGNSSEASFTVTVGLWCSPGSYLAAPADATCTPAPAGSYVPTAGATAPTLCPTGTTSEVGAVSCADVTAPVISDVPSNFLVPATSASGATVTYALPSATDVLDGARPVTCVPPSGSTFVIGSQVVTCTAEDTVGNSSEASFTVTVGLWCSPGSYLAAPADATCTPAPAGSYVPTAGATAPTLCPTGTTSEVGAVSCADVTAPVISAVPSNFLVPATSAFGATVTYTLPSATDVVDGARPVTCVPPSGSVMAIGSQIVTCTAADTVGNSSEASFTVTVGLWCSPGSYLAAPADATCTPAPAGSYVPTAGATAPTLCPTGTTSEVGAVSCADVTAPVITDVPTSFLVPATSASGATVTYTLPTAADVVDGARPVTCVPPSGSTFAIGSQVVTCTAADTVGNTSEANFTVTVGLWCSPGSYLAAPADATCTPAPAGSYVPTAGATAPTLCPAGTTSEVGAVSCADVTAPVISAVPSNFLVPATSASGATVTYTLPSATDVVDGARPVTCAPPSGSTFVIGSQVVTCTTADTVGNSSEASFTVTVGLWCSPGSYLAAPANATCTPAPAGSYVPTAGATAPTLCPTGTTSTQGAVVCVDTTAPVLTNVPANITTETTSSGGKVVTFTAPSATDTRDGALPVTCSPASGSTFPAGATTVSCTATDAAGNITTRTFVITVTVTPPEPEPTGTPGDMSGDGYIRDGNARYEFDFRFRESERRGEAGSLKLKIEYAETRDHRGRKQKRADDRFESTSVTSLVFSDDPAIRRWWWWQWRHDIDTVVATGKGKWNGRSGYTYELRATDQGWPGWHQETLELVIKDASGQIVAQVSGELDGGHIRSRRIRH